MEQQGVDLQTLSAASSYFFYWMAAEETAEFTRWLSDNACKLLGIAN